MLKKTKITKEKIYYKLTTLITSIIILIAITLIIMGLIKIIKENNNLKQGLKEIEEVFGDTNSTSSQNEEENVKSKIENEDSNDFENTNNSNKAIGLITFKLKKEYKIAVYENITEETLKKGAGRATGTSKLNESGNCVLYGHRDSAFRALWDIKVGDLVEVKTRSSTLNYKVENIFITNPEDKNIFKQENDNKNCKITMVTCYPFIYSGPANQRCVVEMRQLGQS